MKAMRGLLAAVTAWDKASAALAGVQLFNEPRGVGQGAGRRGVAGHDMEQLLMRGKAVEVTLGAHGCLSSAAEGNDGIRGTSQRAACLVGDANNGPGADWLMPGR